MLLLISRTTFHSSSKYTDMKKLTSALFLIVFLVSSSLHAQTFDSQASTEFTVWTVQGKVDYKDKNNSNSARVIPGMTIKSDAIVEISPMSSIRLVREKDIFTINDQGSHSLNGDIINKVSERQTKATMFFFEKLIASSKYAGQKGRLSDFGSGYGTESGKKAQKDSGGGYGTQSGKQAKKDQGAGYGTEDNKQAKKDDGGGYGTEDGKQAKKDSGGGYGTEDGKQAKKDSGGGYGTEDGKQAKKDSGGGYGTESGKQAKKDQGAGYGKLSKEAKAKKKQAKKGLKKDRLYKKSEKVQKILMMATAMEKIGLTPEANKCYKKALSKNADHPLTNQMYAAFLDQ